jgi:hypothetical protein
MKAWWTVSLSNRGRLIDSADYETKAPALKCARYWAKYSSAKKLKNRNTWRSWDGNYEVFLSPSCDLKPEASHE